MIFLQFSSFGIVGPEKLLLPGIGRTGAATLALP